MASTGQGPRPESQKRRRPNEAAIFAAALEAFAELGFNGASMREIATRAGTALANLYNYVPGKADLLAHVLRRANDDLLSKLRGALDEAGPSAGEQLRVAVETYVLWSAANQTAGTIAMGEFRYLTGPQRRDVVSARDETQRLFTEIVEQGAANDEFATAHPRQAARNIVLLCSAFATWYRPDGASTPAQMAEVQGRLALGMVEASSLTD
jgi:AcrR family transcriptional regulator